MIPGHNSAPLFLDEYMLLHEGRVVTLRKEG